MIRAAVFCLAVMSLANVSAGQMQSATQQEGAAQAKDLARERVTLTFNKVPAADVFRPLAKSLGYELHLDPDLRELLTIHVENVTARTALTAICESIGCRWEQHEKQIWILTSTSGWSSGGVNAKGRALHEQMKAAGRVSGLWRVASLDEELPYDQEWGASDLGGVLTSLASSFRGTVRLAPSLTGRRVSVTIKSATLRQAFDAVCAAARCRWEVIEGPPVHQPPAPPYPSRVFDVTDAGGIPEPQRAAAQAPGRRPRFRILWSADPSSAIGGVIVRAEMAPPDASVDLVQFFGDGRLICSVKAAPFECRWNVGPDVRKHTIRVVVALPDGQQLSVGMPIIWAEGAVPK